MFLFPSGASSLTDHPWWFALLAAAGLVTSFTSTLMFTALGSFYTRISDPDMGGSYLTLLNTIANMGEAFLCLSGRVEGSTIQDRNVIPHAALCVCNMGEPPSEQCKLEGAPCMKESIGQTARWLCTIKLYCLRRKSPADICWPSCACTEQTAQGNFCMPCMQRG